MLVWLVSMMSSAQAMIGPRSSFSLAIASRRLMPWRGQRVWAAALRVALEQAVLVGVQEDDLAADALAAELLDQAVAGTRGRSAPAARVDADREVLVERISGGDDLGDDRVQQCCRHVVDAVEADVLQQVQRNALAGTRQATDDDEAHWAVRLAAPLPASAARLSAVLVVLVVMRLDLFLVLLDLAVELVHQRVDRSVHVVLHRVGEQRIAADIDLGFGLVPQLLHA